MLLQYVRRLGRRRTFLFQTKAASVEPPPLSCHVPCLRKKELLNKAGAEKGSKAQIGDEAKKWVIFLRPRQSSPLFRHHHSSLAHEKLHPRDPACIYYQHHAHSFVLHAQAEQEWASAEASPLPSSPSSYFPSFLAPSAAAARESGSAPRRPRVAASGFGTSRTAWTSSRKWWRTRSE